MLKENEMTENDKIWHVARKFVKIELYKEIKFMTQILGKDFELL